MSKALIDDLYNGLNTSDGKKVKEMFQDKLCEELYEIDSDLNTANTGIKARVTTLESQIADENKVRIFDKISDAQTFAGYVVGDIGYCLGYHSKGDGGGHYFIYSLTDDGRGIIAGSGFLNLFSNKIEGYVNPRWLGAIPNGTDSIFYLNKCRLYNEPIYSTEEFSVASEFFTDEAKIKLLRLTPTQPTNVFNCGRNSKIEGLEIDCKNIEMGSFYAFRIKPSNSPLPIDYNYDIRNVKLKGNSSNLQGIGLYLETLKTDSNTYSLIQFIRANNFQISGFRDGISMLNNMSAGGTCYINGNIFTNFDILHCFRPVRLICNGTQGEIDNGFSISGNFFDKFMLQHTVGTEDAWHLEGATNNYIDSFNFDWTGNEFYFDSKSRDNEILNDSTVFNKVNDVSGRNKISKELKCQAKVVFDGTTSPPTIKTAFNISSVIKNSTGNYTVNLIKSLRTANEAVSIDGNTMSVGYNLTCHTHNGYTTTAIPIVCHKTDGTFVDLTRISMIVI